MMSKDYWIDFGDNHPAGASGDLINEVEGNLGVKLPENYLQAMRVQNGGWLCHCIYCVREFLLSGTLNPDDLAEPYCIDLNPWIPLEQLVPLRVPHEEGWDIQVEGLDLLIVFRHEGGARFWCFDYREAGPQGGPSIVYINGEGSYPGGDPARKELVAARFEISAVEVDPRTYKG